MTRTLAGAPNCHHDVCTLCLTGIPTQRISEAAIPQSEVWDVTSATIDGAEVVVEATMRLIGTGRPRLAGG